MKDERLQVIKDSVNLQLALAEKLNFDKNTIELITEEIELLDYITNLQEENVNLKTKLKWKENRIDKVIEYLEYQISQLDFEKDTKAKMLGSMVLVLLQGRSDE